jgi:iron complex transport system substrate-binding protein
MYLSMPQRTISRRHLLAAVPGALAIAAGISCGDDGESGSTTNSSGTGGQSPATAALRLIPLTPQELGAPPVPAPVRSTASNATPHEAAVAPYASFGSDASPAAFPRTIRHAKGETRISSQPQRVVAMDTGELDGLVELGVKPVGAVDYGSAGLPSYLQGATDGVEIVGSINEPNLEKIASLRPDLILSSTLRHDSFFDRLSQLAPTVFAERPGVSWKLNFALYAQALGREAEAAKTVERFETQVHQLNQNLPQPRPTVSVVRILQGNLRYYQQANFLGVLLTDLGIPGPRPRTWTTSVWTWVSRASASTRRGTSSW